MATTLQKPWTMLVMKNGLQQRRKTPMITPTVIVAWNMLQGKDFVEEIHLFALSHLVLFHKAIANLSLCRGL